jgi:hypothetical protein
MIVILIVKEGPFHLRRHHSHGKILIQQGVSNPLRNFFHIIKWNSFIGLTKMMKTKEVANNKENHQVTIGWAK